LLEFQIMNLNEKVEINTEQILNLKLKMLKSVETLVHWHYLENHEVYKMDGIKRRTFYGMYNLVIGRLYFDDLLEYPFSIKS